MAFTNCGTSVFAAIVIFAIMGFKAHNSYDECLAANERLMNMSEVVGETWVVTSAGDNVTLVTCDLGEQLDKSASGTGLAFILFTGEIQMFRDEFSII